MENKLAKKVIEQVNKEWVCPVTICPLDSNINHNNIPQPKNGESQGGDLEA